MGSPGIGWQHCASSTAMPSVHVQQLVRHHQRQFAPEADAGEQFLPRLQAVVSGHAVPHRRIGLGRFGVERGDGVVEQALA